MKKFTVEIKWAIRYIFAFLFWIIIEKYTGLYTINIKNYPTYSALFYLLAFVIFYLAIAEKKKKYFNNNLDWKQGAISGVYMSIFIAILMPFCLIIAYKGIAPEFFPNMIQNAIASGKTKLTVAQDYFNIKSYIFQGLFFTLSIGVVFSVIVAQFLKNNKK